MIDLIVSMLHELRVVLRCDIGEGGSGRGIRLLELEVANKYCGLFFGYITRAGEKRNRTARQHAEVSMMFCKIQKEGTCVHSGGDNRIYFERHSSLDCQASSNRHT